MLRKIRGRRTYIVAWLMLVSALVLWAVGDLSAAQATEQVFEALGMMGLRAGVGQSGGGNG